MNNIRRTMHQLTLFLAFTIVAIAAVASAWPCGALAQDSTPAIPANQVVWQHVGRIYLDPHTGSAVYAGYLTHLNGITGSLFDGAPSEATAYLTFSTDVLSITPIASNGDVALSLVSAGTFNVYYNPHPGGDWGAPSTFSSGQLIATFVRGESLFPQLGPIGFHNLSETLGSSRHFDFHGQLIDFKRMTPNGITFAQFFSSTPIVTEIQKYPVSFAAAGTTTAVGGAPADPER